MVPVCYCAFLLFQAFAFPLPFRPDEAGDVRKAYGGSGHPSWNRCHRPYPGSVVADPDFHRYRRIPATPCLFTCWPNAAGGLQESQPLNSRRERLSMKPKISSGRAEIPLTIAADARPYPDLQKLPLDQDEPLTKSRSCPQRLVAPEWLTLDSIPNSPAISLLVHEISGGLLFDANSQFISRLPGASPEKPGGGSAFSCSLSRSGLTIAPLTLAGDSGASARIRVLRKPRLARENGIDTQTAPASASAKPRTAASAEPSCPFLRTPDQQRSPSTTDAHPRRFRH